MCWHTTYSTRGPESRWKPYSRAQYITANKKSSQFPCTEFSSCPTRTHLYNRSHLPFQQEGKLPLSLEEDSVLDHCSTSSNCFFSLTLWTPGPDPVTYHAKPSTCCLWQLHQRLGNGHWPPEITITWHEMFLLWRVSKPQLPAPRLFKDGRVQWKAAQPVYKPVNIPWAW